MKKIRTILMMFFVLVFVANAFEVSVDNVFWNGGTGSWMTPENWTETEAPYWLVPGWVAGNPNNSGSWAYDGNRARAVIQSGTAQITAASTPDGQIFRTYIGGESGANLDILSTSGDNGVRTWQVHLGNIAGQSGTINQSGGNVNLRGAAYIGENGYGAYNLSGGSLTVGNRDVYLGRNSGATGELTISGGTFTQVTGNYAFYLGNYGTGIVNQTGGDAVFDLLRIGYRSTGDGGNIYTISGGTFQHNKYMGIYNDATFKVSGSGAESIRIMQLNTSGEGAGSKLAVELDALGSTLIEVYGSGDDPYTNGADLSYVTLLVDTLTGFNGALGDKYDILWSATNINTTGLSLVSLSDIAFAWDVIDYNDGKLLQLTVIPEPASMILLGVGCLILSSRRKK